MALRIPLGDENFEGIRKSGLYYVDKTELIYDLVGGTDQKVIKRGLFFCGACVIVSIVAESRSFLQRENPRD